MFCGNCGTENPNEAKFCKSCGKALDQFKVDQESEKVESSQVESRVDEEKTSAIAPKSPESKSVGKPKKAPIKLVFGICAAMVVVISIVYMLANIGTTINLNDYLTIEPQGYDGYGELKASVDWDAIEEEYGDKLVFTDETKQELRVLMGFMDPVDILSDLVHVDLDSTTGLSNGDEVMIKWSVSEDISKVIKSKLKYKDEAYRVSGLVQVETFNAFADLNVNFYNTAPYGNIGLRYDNEYLENHDFEVDKGEGLSNGDTVKVTIKEDALNRCVKYYGRVPELREMEYTVSGLGHFPLNIAEIEADEEGFAGIQQQALQFYKEGMYKSEDQSLEDFIYLGNYYLTTKDSKSPYQNNMLVMVYKAQIRNKYSEGTSAYDKVNEIYWFVSFEDLVISSDGKVEAEFDWYDLPRAQVTIDSGISEGWWNTVTWTYPGYSTLEALYKDVVTSKLDNYNHEDNLDMSSALTLTEDLKAIEDGYVFINTNEELISKEDLERLLPEECQLLKSEIYARHGMKFDDDFMQAYFQTRSWYDGTIEPSDFDESVLSETEKENIRMISEYEKRKGYDSYFD